MSHICSQPCRKQSVMQNDPVRDNTQVFRSASYEKENLCSLHSKSRFRSTSTTNVNVAVQRFKGESNVAQIVNFELDRPETIADRERRSELRYMLLQNHRRRSCVTTLPVLHAQNEVVVKNHARSPLWSDVNHPPSNLYVDPHSLQLCTDHRWSSFDHGPIWESSGVQPGQPGYGYSREGVPTGSDYILYMRGRKASNNFNKDQSRDPEQNERVSVVEELVQARWSEPELVLERAARPHAKKRRRRPFSVKDAMTHNNGREIDELYNVQEMNGEFEL